jgi:hypothetical protein
MLAAVRAMTILSSFRETGPPFESNTKILNVFSPGFARLSSTVAPSLSAIRPDDQPVSRLSIWNSVPAAAIPPTFATIRALESGVRAM